MTTNSPTNTNQASEDELKEKLAEIEHERWADWQKWIHLVYENPTRPFEEAIANWKVQIDTPYSKLSDREKASDMEQVDRYWPLVLSFIRTEKLKLLAEIGEPKLEDAINEEKTPEGVKSAPKEPNDIFIILSPYFECKDCGELGCPYNPDVPAELAEAIDQYTQSKLKAFEGDMEQAQRVLEAYLDDEECSFDHHGYCQTHNLNEVDQRCVNIVAKESVQALKAVKERWINE